MTDQATDSTAGVATLLAVEDLPDFAAIRPEPAPAAVKQSLAESREAINALLGQKSYNWDNLLKPLEDIDDRLSKVWSPIGHLNAVMNSDAWRDAYNACLPELSEYSTEMGQHEGLCEAFKQLKASDSWNELDEAQQKIVTNALRDFRLSGIDLPDDKKARYKAIALRSSELSSKFSENLMDATNAWKKHITDVAELKGVPESSLAMFQQSAEQRLEELPEDEAGWLLTLEFPSYHAVITYADNRELRREMYEAFSTRASEVGPQLSEKPGEWDNREIMGETLALRQELAQLLGFNNYAEESLATKMANSVDQVIEFLRELAAKARPGGERDLAELRAFAAENGCDDLQSWDVAYYSEKLKMQKYSVSDEELRPYFPLSKVMPGLFEVAKRLFDIDIKANGDKPVWHPDAKAFDVHKDGELIARFYVDLYARQHKRGGAWMDGCRSRKNMGGELQLPVAYLVCNFTPPVGDVPALLTHSEVETLFHEFGHGIHHMLTTIDYPSVAGISGVAWDAVELPSQIMENWCWEREALDVISGHVDTGEPLPAELFDKMLAAKSFQSGLFMLRQVEFV